jgi:hypothetical protein
LIIRSKHGSSDRSTSSGKRKRKSVIFEERLDGIKSYEHNESTIRKRGLKIKEAVEVA